MRAHALLSLAVLVSATSACSRPAVRGIATIEEDEAPLKSAIEARNPMDEPQLASGFYPAERDGWRWTRGQFALVLQAPKDAATKGAMLELVWDAPSAVVDRVGPVTLSAVVHGVGLKEETRDKPGILAYRRFVPPAAIVQPEVLVEVSLDRVVKPFTTPGEDRELGVAFHRAALKTVDAADAKP